MTKVTDKSLWGMRLVNDLEVVLRIKDFNHFFFFFFFFGGWLGRGSLVLSRVLKEWLYL